MFNPNKKYGILGLARSGIAAAYKIKEMGGKAFLSEVQWKDKVSGSTQLEQDFECEFGGHTAKLFECDEWIVSPGIPLSIPIIQQGKARGISMISEIEFGFQIKAPDSKIIAVTGSNGKSTTASLIYHILVGAGKNAILAGNIGDAFCGYPIHQPGIEYIVLEISSFQLDLIQTFKPNVSVILNITPDHLNRYESFDHYAASKFRITENQDGKDYAILNLDSEIIAKHVPMIKANQKYFSIQKQYPETDAWMDGKFICFEDLARISMYDLSLRGPHNHANVMASVLAVYSLIGDLDIAIQNLKGFKPLSHRLELVGTVNGVFFYNDSKATNTDSVRSALMSFESPIRIIMGGSDKGEDFGTLTDILKAKASKVYITGETEGKMRQAWLGKLPLVCISDFRACVRAAFEDSLAGDTVVLSPGCASYDRFQNFEHRGETFRQIVQEIIKENEKN